MTLQDGTPESDVDPFAEIERPQLQWAGMKDEVNLCHAEIKRLRAERDDYVGRLEVAIEKIVELRAERDDYMRLADSLQAEKSNLKAAEIERLRSEKDHWIIRCEQREAEIERLRALVGEIQKSETRHVDETRRLRSENGHLKFNGRAAVIEECVQELESFSHYCGTNAQKVIADAITAIRALKS